MCFMPGHYASARSDSNAAGALHDGFIVIMFVYNKTGYIFLFAMFCGE